MSLSTMNISPSGKEGKVLTPLLEEDVARNKATCKYLRNCRISQWHVCILSKELKDICKKVINPTGLCHTNITEYKGLIFTLILNKYIWTDFTGFISNLLQHDER